MSDEIKKSEERSLNFLEEIIEEDLKTGKYKNIVTRFPPEPNGYLHIGHATSICLNFGLTKKYGGYTNLRFDDTNPVTEETEYVDSIKDDVRWLGFEWKNEHYASDYFDKLYEFAINLIKKGFAYVDDSSSEEIAEQKGTPTQAGSRNKFADRSMEENLQLFAEMKDGKYQDGTLEFVPHRELYDWCIEKLEIYPSKQYEFARRNMTYTVMSKRKLLQLVTEKHVTC